ncbi:unnamed protein product [Gongylonema pulchrum]|uniref:Uncharacterized protein n=1 Tax=Gongylonema pulchrum TaxID=637853 RepID=A0A183EN29_9BILA|nr:unnamed protein product [Gongylonema pulchrum]
MCERLYSRRPLQYCTEQALNGHQLSSPRVNNRMFVDDLKNLRNLKNQQTVEASATNGVVPGIQARTHLVDRTSANSTTIGAASIAGSFYFLLFAEMACTESVVATNRSLALHLQVISAIRLFPDKTEQGWIRLARTARAGHCEDNKNSCVTEEMPRRAVPKPPSKQTEERTKSGKRRIQPTFVASVTVPEAAEPTSVATATSEGPDGPTQPSSVHLSACPSKSSGRVDDVEKMDTSSGIDKPVGTQPEPSGTEQKLPQLLAKPAPEFAEALPASLHENRSIIFPIPQKKRSLSVSLPPVSYFVRQYVIIYYFRRFFEIKKQQN